jgi:hypothetical protein
VPSPQQAASVKPRWPIIRVEHEAPEYASAGAPASTPKQPSITRNYPGEIRASAHHANGHSADSPAIPLATASANRGHLHKNAFEMTIRFGPACSRRSRYANWRAIARAGRDAACGAEKACHTAQDQSRLQNVNDHLVRRAGGSWHERHGRATSHRERSRARSPN